MQDKGLNESLPCSKTLINNLKVNFLTGRIYGKI